MPIGKPWWFQQFVCEAALKGADCGLKFEERMQHAWKSWSQVWVCTVCFCVVCAVCSGMAFIYVAVRLVSCTVLGSAPYWSLYVFWQQFYFCAASKLELSYTVHMHEGDRACCSVEPVRPKPKKACVAAAVKSCVRRGLPSCSWHSATFFKCSAAFAMLSPALLHLSWGTFSLCLWLIDLSGCAFMHNHHCWDTRGR